MKEWTPKVGEEVKLKAFSNGCRKRLVNIRLAKVKHVTRSGALSVTLSAHVFQRIGAKKFMVHVPKKYQAVLFSQYIERATKADLAKLPRTIGGGRAFARTM
jgi:hypothetical protein